VIRRLTFLHKSEQDRTHSLSVIISSNIYEDLINHRLDSRLDSTDKVILNDHLGGFNKDMNNLVLDYLESVGFDKPIDISYVVSSDMLDSYPTLDISHPSKISERCLGVLYNYSTHPCTEFKNFLCSFNGSDHVGRQLLSSIMDNFGLFDSRYSSKNFSYPESHIDGHFSNMDLTDDEIRLYRKFFINSSEFLDTVFTFGHVQYNHAQNIYNLEHKLTKSFIHIVSETLSTSYYPFITEKFVYSIVTRGLFVANGQPLWHEYLEDAYGFKLYDKIFDYSFDKIKNPIKRIIKMMEMLSKFSHLSIDDWNDLYLMEKDNIEYNYDHYFSKQYLKYLPQ